MELFSATARMRKEECRRDHQRERWEGYAKEDGKEIIVGHGKRNGRKRRFSVILDGSCDSNLKIHFILKGRR
jgi:hypothetical protein